MATAASVAVGTLDGRVVAVSRAGRGVDKALDASVAAGDQQAQKAVDIVVVGVPRVVQRAGFAAQRNDAARSPRRSLRARGVGVADVASIKVKRAQAASPTSWRTSSRCLDGRWKVIQANHRLAQAQQKPSRLLPIKPARMIHQPGAWLGAELFTQGCRKRSWSDAASQTPEARAGGLGGGLSTTPLTRRSARGRRA